MDARDDGTTTALITGANKGIGFAVARALADRGIRVVVGARDGARRDEAVERLRASGADAVGVALDVTSEESVSAAADEIGERLGRLDVLVNNAGISGPFASGEQTPSRLDLDVLRRVLDTNVFGVVRVTNAMLPLLRRSPAPRIVNVSSNMGSLALHTGPLLGAYSPSKTMLNGLTVQYAREFADGPIIVNSACPGYVATDFTGFAAPRTPEEGAMTIVRLATLPDDGPRGGFFDDGGVVPW